MSLSSHCFSSDVCEKLAVCDELSNGPHGYTMFASATHNGRLRSVILSKEP